MPEMSQAPGMGPEAFGPKPDRSTIDLNQNKIDVLTGAPKTKENLPGLAGAYFSSLNTYLEASGRNIQGLEQQYQELPADVKSFAEGITELHHVTEKDADRILGRVMIVKMTQAMEDHLRQGAEQIPQSQLTKQTAEMQRVWDKLTNRARAQVMRGIRHMVTEDNGWEHKKVKVGDWTTFQTTRRDAKTHFSQVLDDLNFRVTNLNTKFGSAQMTESFQNLRADLEKQIKDEGITLTRYITDGVKGLRAGIGIMSSSPDVQKRVESQLKELEDIELQYTGVRDEAQKSDWSSQEDMDFLLYAAGQSEQLSKTVNKILAERRKQGHVAGALGVEVAELKGTISTEGLEWITEAAVAVDIIDRLGKWESSAIIPLGKTEEITVFETLVSKTPLLGGERHRRELLRDKGQRQLDAVEELVSGKFRDFAQARIDIVRSNADLDTKQKALRELKDVGVTMKQINSFRDDVSQLSEAGATAPKDIPDDMKAAWDQLRIAAVDMDKVINQVPKLNIAASSENQNAVAGLAEQAMQYQIKRFDVADLSGVDVRSLFSDAGYREFMLEQKGKLGRGIKDALRFIWMRRSPSRLTGVEWDEKRSRYHVGGLGLELAKGIQGVGHIIDSKDALKGAFATNGETAKIHANVAFMMTRLGLGEAGERLRTLFSKYHDVRGLEGSMLSTKINNVLHSEEIAAGTGILAGATVLGALVAEAAPYIGHLTSIAGEKISQYADAKVLKETFNVEHFRNLLDMINGTHIQGVDVVQDAIQNPAFADQVSQTAKAAGEQLLAQEAQIAQSGLDSAQNAVSWNQQLSSWGAERFRQGAEFFNQGKAFFEGGDVWNKVLKSAAMGASVAGAIEVATLPRKALDKLFPDRRKGKAGKLLSKLVF